MNNRQQRYIREITCLITHQAEVNSRAGESFQIWQERAGLLNQPHCGWERKTRLISTTESNHNTWVWHWNALQPRWKCWK